MSKSPIRSAHCLHCQFTVIGQSSSEDALHHANGTGHHVVYKTETLVKPTVPNASVGTKISSEFFDQLIINSDLSNRIKSSMFRSNYLYFGDIIALSEGELLRTDNLGKQSLDELIIYFAEYGITLPVTVYQWTRPNIDSLLSKPIPTKGLNYRVQEVLDRFGLLTLGDLTTMMWKDMSTVKNAGTGTYTTLQNILFENNLFFGINGFTERTSSTSNIDALIYSSYNPLFI